MQGMPRVLSQAVNNNHWSSFLQRSILCDSQWNVEHIWQLWVDIHFYTHILIELYNLHKWNHLRNKTPIFWTRQKIYTRKQNTTAFGQFLLIKSCLSSIERVRLKRRSSKVAAVQNGQNLSGNFGFLTQIVRRIIQPACLVREFYLTHFIWPERYHNFFRRNLKFQTSCSVN